MSTTTTSGSSALQPHDDTPADDHGVEALLGAAFTTPKELRHIAEQTLDRLFVPTEAVAEREHDADFVLHLDGQGDVHVHAEREQPWNPFVVTRVDAVAR